MILLKGIKFSKIKGIALWPFVLVLPRHPDDVLINHERIHLRQQIEMGIVLFYIWYFFEWSYHFLRTKSRWAAYRLISFEKEAYAHESDLQYLKTRRLWSFLKYL